MALVVASILLVWMSAASVPAFALAVHTHTRLPPRGERHAPEPSMHPSHHPQQLQAAWEGSVGAAKDGGGSTGQGSMGGGGKGGMSEAAPGGEQAPSQLRAEAVRLRALLAAVEASLAAQEAAAPAVPAEPACTPPLPTATQTNHLALTFRHLAIGSCIPA